MACYAVVYVLGIPVTTMLIIYITMAPLNGMQKFCKSYMALPAQLTTVWVLELYAPPFYCYGLLHFVHRESLKGDIVHIFTMFEFKNSFTNVLWKKYAIQRLLSEGLRAHTTMSLVAIRCLVKYKFQYFEEIL